MKLKLLLLLILSLIPFSFCRTAKVGGNGCTDINTISFSNSIQLPSKYKSKFDRPWLNGNLSTRLHSSAIFGGNWRWLQSLKVQGLNSTLGEILQILEHNGCFFVGYGSEIKDIFLGKIKGDAILKITGETTCNSQMLQRLCAKHFGLENCSSPKHFKDKITIGNHQASRGFSETIVEPLTLHPWDSMLNTDRMKWGFSVDECGLFDDLNGNVYFIDYTAQSHADICQSSVKIPVQAAYWEGWAANNLLKILEVYNIIADGFRLDEPEYKFVTKYIKDNFSTTSFQEYYCSLYGGKFYPWFVQTIANKEQIQNRSQCHFLTPNSRRNRLIKKINETLQEDFQKFWFQTMVSSLDGMILFEDKGKQPEPVTVENVITVYHESDSNGKNGRARTRNAFDDKEILPTKGFDVNLNIDCDKDHSAVNNQQVAASTMNELQIFPSPNLIPVQTIQPPIFVPRVEYIIRDLPYIPARNVHDGIPNPIHRRVKTNKFQKKNIWNAWNSATSNYYLSQDQIPQLDATDY